MQDLKIYQRHVTHRERVELESRHIARAHRDKVRPDRYRVMERTHDLRELQMMLGREASCEEMLKHEGAVRDGLLELWASFN